MKSIKSLKSARRGISFLILGLLCFMPLSTVGAAPNTQRAEAFQTAAREFGVPADILKAVSYNQSRWENHDGKPSVSGGYGLMHLTTSIEPVDGRGNSKPMQTRQLPQMEYTLDKAAQLLGVAPKELQTNDTQNIRGAAAVLAQYAKESNNGQQPVDLKDWYGAVARIGNAPDKKAAQDFADSVYDTIKTGANRTTLDGQAIGIPAQSVEPDRAEVQKLKLPEGPSSQSNGQAECPPTITCKFVPARFAQNNPDNPADYGNYDIAKREKDFDIKYIVIHDTEGSYQSAIDWYRDPRSYVSAQYTIRSSDGEVTQSVKNDDIAWQAGNWYMNTRSIGIEHEGFAAEGAAWYTDTMYRSSAKLVRYLAAKYDIPLDRKHIIGHGEIPGINPTRATAMHWDPGPYWDWERYMELLNQPTIPAAGSDSKAVTIAPKFSNNKPTVTQCEEEACTSLPEQPANFVYVRTRPEHTAPLVTDAALRASGEPGTTRIEDWGAKATHGEQFAVVERKGDWTAIWFNGQKGWFFNPRSSSRTAVASKARFVTPKSGKRSVPVYGRPLPEESAYPDIPDIPVEPIIPLQYSIPSGQKYVAYEKQAINDYYLIWTFDFSGPGDGTIVYGNEKYIPIVFNHRQAFVKASDVTWSY